jgi:hypothetical protein
MKAADAQPVVDGVLAETEVEELSMSHNAVLASGESRNRVLDEFWGFCTVHMPV